MRVMWWYLLCIVEVITIITAGRNDSVPRAKDVFDLSFHSLKSRFKARALCPTFWETLSPNSSWCPASWHSWTQWRLPAISWFQKAVLQSQQRQLLTLWEIGCGTEAFTDSGRGVWTWWMPDKADLNETAFSFVLITEIINISGDPTCDAALN